MFLESTCGIIALLVIAQRVMTPADGPLDGPDAAAPARAASPGMHPHTRTVRLKRTRRPGTVEPRPAHCISPVGRARAAVGGS